MINASLKQLSASLAEKKISSVELTQLYLDRIATHNPVLNAYVTVEGHKSLAQAKAADAMLANGTAQVLTGIPIAQKDIFCAQGWRTTCGSKMLDNFIAPYDAHVISQFNAAGAVNLGKTNMDEFAMGSSNETSYFGPVRNPWDIKAVPGGSSGGAASAVAARLCAAATGTDTGGSIRQPAALCGITGIKPTYGTVSRYGMIAFASSLDQAGPMARSAEDCALMLNVMTGHDPRDSTSLVRDKEDYTRELNQPLAGLRIGLPREFFAEGLSQDVGAVRASRRRRISEAGCDRGGDQSAQCQAGRAGLLRVGASRSVEQSVAFRRRALRLSRTGLHRPHRHVREDPCTRFRRGSKTPHHDRHVCVEPRLLRCVLSAGTEDTSTNRAGFRRSVQTVRRDHGADQPIDRLQFGREGRRSGADVSVRYLHHRGQSGWPARHVHPLRHRRERHAGGLADHRRLFQGSADARTSRINTNWRRTGTAAHLKACKETL